MKDLAIKKQQKGKIYYNIMGKKVYPGTGKFAPKSKYTREEFEKVLDKIIADEVFKPLYEAYVEQQEKEYGRSHL